MSLADGTVLQTLHGVGSVSSVAFSPDSQILAIGSQGVIQLWSIVEAKTLQAFKAHTGYVRWVAFTPEISSVLTSGSYDDIASWGLWYAEFHALLTGNTRVRDLQAVQNMLQKCGLSPPHKEMAIL